MEEGTITKWIKREGEFVKAGDVLIEVATDKATVEHSALDDGWLRKILIKEDQTAIVNQPIAIFTEKREESIEGYQPEGVLLQAAGPAAARASIDEDVKTAATPKPAAGASLSQPAFVPEPPLLNYQFSSPSGEIPERLKTSPLARKLAKEKGIDLTTVKGTGPQGRIVARDLELGQPASIVTFGRREAPTIAPGTYEETSLSPMRKVIGQRLQESKTFIPHFYVTQEINAERLVAVRTELATAGIKITYNDLVIRACALALREHPQINAGFNSVTQSIISFKTIDIAVAVSLASGLITPIIRHADYKNLGQISSEMKSLATRARDGKLTHKEYVGGSFTVSNIGMFGVDEFKAIINPPQAAILAVGGIMDHPIVKEGAVVPGKVMRCTLSADHRILDGTDAAKFIKTLQKFLENPSILVL